MLLCGAENQGLALSSCPGCSVGVGGTEGTVGVLLPEGTSQPQLGLSGAHIQLSCCPIPTQGRLCLFDSSQLCREPGPWFELFPGYFLGCVTADGRGRTSLGCG